MSLYPQTYDDFIPTKLSTLNAMELISKYPMNAY